MKKIIESVSEYEKELVKLCRKSYAGVTKNMNRIARLELTQQQLKDNKILLIRSCVRYMNILSIAEASKIMESKYILKEVAKIDTDFAIIFRDYLIKIKS